MDMGGILDLETKLPENFHRVGGFKKNPLSHSSRCYINSESLTQQNKIEQQQSVQHTTPTTTSRE
jgi:hypothetical protein